MMSWVGILVIPAIVAFLAGTLALVRKSHRSSSLATKAMKLKKTNEVNQLMPIYLSYQERTRVRIRSKKVRGRFITGMLVGHLVDKRGQKVFALIETTRGGTPAKRRPEEVYVV